MKSQKKKNTTSFPQNSWSQVPSLKLTLKLTQPLKMMVPNRNLLFPGAPIFRCYVSFREGNHGGKIDIGEILKSKLLKSWKAILPKVGKKCCKLFSFCNMLSVQKSQHATIRIALKGSCCINFTSTVVSWQWSQDTRFTKQSRSIIFVDHIWVSQTWKALKFNHV